MTNKQLKKVLTPIVKGAGIGISVAGTINTIAPGLFPYVSGVITGMNNAIAWWQKLGISVVAITAPQEISGWLIIGVGAVVGATVYTMGMLGKRLAIGIWQKLKNKKGKIMDI